MLYYLHLPAPKCPILPTTVAGLWFTYLHHAYTVSRLMPPPFTRSWRRKARPPPRPQPWPQNQELFATSLSDLGLENERKCLGRAEKRLEKLENTMDRELRGARRVLPVPGGPTKSPPLGTRAPEHVRLDEIRRFKRDFGIEMDRKRTEIEEIEPFSLDARPVLATRTSWGSAGSPRTRRPPPWLDRGRPHPGTSPRWRILEEHPRNHENKMKQEQTP